MAEPTNTKRWWETLPAMLTGVAALVTAIVAAAALLNRPGPTSSIPSSTAATDGVTTTGSGPKRPDSNGPDHRKADGDHERLSPLAKVIIELDTRGAGKKATTPVTLELRTMGGLVIAQGQSDDVEFKKGTRYPVVLAVVRHPRREAPYVLRVGMQTRRHDVWEFTASAVLHWRTGEITRINFDPARLMETELSIDLPQVAPAI